MSAKVRMVPWGVHVPAAPREARPADQPLAIAVLAEPDSKDHPNALLEALTGFDPDSRALPVGARERVESDAPRAGLDHDEHGAEADAEPWTQLPDRPMVFVDEASRSWLNRAGKLDEVGLRDRITLTPSLEANRVLALRCDALILPTSAGTLRSLALDAMAVGVRVIAVRGNGIHILQDGATAFLTASEAPDTGAWSAVLDRAFPEDERGNPLLESARRAIREQCLASHQVAELIHLYTELAGPPPALAFDDPGGGSKNANA